MSANPYDRQRILRLTETIEEQKRRIVDLEIESRRLAAVKSEEIGTTMNAIVQQRLTEAEFHLWALIGVLGLEPVDGEPEEMTAARAWLVAS